MKVTKTFDVSGLSQKQLLSLKEDIDFYLSTKQGKVSASNDMKTYFAILVDYLEKEYGISYPALDILKKSDKALHTKVINTLKDYEAWANKLFQGNNKSLKINKKQFIALSMLFIVSTIVSYFIQNKIVISLKSIMNLKKTTFQEIITRYFPGYPDSILVSVIIKTI